MNTFPYPTADLWMQQAAGRLQAEKFEIVPFPPGSGPFALIAHRNRFEITKTGMTGVFWVFADAPGLTLDGWHRFCADARLYAQQSRKGGLPLGLGAALITYPVAFTDRLDSAVRETILATSPTKDFAAFEMPVVCERTTGDVLYYPKTPMWGALYYPGFRRQVQRILTPGF